MSEHPMTPRDPDDDPMLRGAREHYEDAVYYDYTYRQRRDDVAFYTRLARQHRGPVLELGIGSGRVGIAIAQTGAEVVGVDPSAPMLTRAKERAQSLGVENLTLCQGDMRSLALGRRFGLVIAPFNALLHLYEPDDFRRCFESVRAHLAPGGRFVFDVRVPSPAELARNPERWYKCRGFVHPRLGVKVAYYERFFYDPIKQVQYVTMRFEPEGAQGPFEVLLTQRQIFPNELRALLALGGLKMVKRWGDFSGRPLGPDDIEMVLECVSL